MSQLVEKTIEAAARRKADARAKYEKLVMEAARGVELNPDDLVDFLAAAGLEVHEFQADVELKANRIAWRAEADKLPKLRAELDTTAGKIAAANAQFEADAQAAREKHAAAVDPLGARQSKLQAAIRTAEAAEEKLLSVGADPAVLDRQEAAKKRRNALIEEKARVAERLRRAEQENYGAEKRAEAAEGRRPNHVNPASRKVEQQILDRQAREARNTADGLRGAIEEGRKRLEELEGEVRAAAAEWERIGREALAP
jgi:hypothetical protein